MENKAVQNMSVERLVCRPQVRGSFNEESLVGLAQTIKEAGVLQPLLVRRDGSEFVVVEGHRRLPAAKLAGETHVPVIVDDRELSEDEVIYRQLVVNCAREALKPLDEARAICRLMEITKWSAAQVAVKLGKSPSALTKLLKLLELPDQIQKQVATGDLPLSTAYELSHVSDADTQRQLAEQAVNGELRRDDVAKRTKSRKRTAATRQCKRNNRIVIPLGGGRSVAVIGPDLTLQTVVVWLQDLLNRIGGLESQDMGLEDAVKVLTQQSA